MYKNTLIALSLASSLGAQRPPEARMIATPNAKAGPRFGGPSNVRQLSNGALLVNDTQRRQLVLVDPTLAKSTIVADSAIGQPSSYGAKAGGLIPFVADSTLFVDPDGLSMFVIDPVGRIARVASVPRAQDAGALTSTSAGLDAKGRLVYRGPSRVKQVVNGGLTLAQFPDSVDLDRVDLTTRRVDTAGYVKVQKMNMTVTQTEHGTTIGGEINPVQTIDEWAVLSDGSLAIVRGLDYRVDIFDGSGHLRSSTKIPFVWRPLPDEQKVVVLDSAKRAMDRMMANPGAMAAMHGGGGPAPIRPAPASPNSAPPFKLVAMSALPDYWPPFGQGAVRGDADGNLWVRTTAVRDGAIGGPIYDVISGSGALLDRVQVPAGRQVVGFGPGGIVYLSANDAGGAAIERTTLAKGVATAATPPDSSGALLGSWEGPFRSDGGMTGTLSLTITRDSTWHVRSEIATDNGTMPGADTDVRVDGGNISWVRHAGDITCKAFGSVESGILTGDIDCGHAKVSYTLKKKKA